MTTSANTTTTTTVNTNLREFLTPRSDNTPSGPIVKVETKTEYNHQTKITSTAIVQSIDVKATNTTNLSATKKSFSKEVMAGKKIGSAEAGLFSSVKITNENNKNTKQTDVGIKASYTTPSVKNTSVSVGVKAGESRVDDLSLFF